MCGKTRVHECGIYHHTLSMKNFENNIFSKKDIFSTSPSIFKKPLYSE